MDELTKYYKESLLNNLCAEYKGYWQSASRDKKRLVDLVLAQQSLPHFLTYCHEGKGLSEEYITRNFGEYINGKYTAVDVDGVQGGYKTEIYVGFKHVLSLSDDVSCFMWCDIPQLEIKPTKAVKIYAGCSTDISLVCGGYNNVVIMLFDDSKITLDDVDVDSNILVYKYSEDCQVEKGKFCLGKVKEFRKELRL